MEQKKIKLSHPAGKKAISMDENKYNIMEKAILSSCSTKEELTHSELLNNVNEYFTSKKIKFEGSVEWHMEWVKLNLESKKKIKRISEKTPVKFKRV